MAHGLSRNGVGLAVLLALASASGWAQPQDAGEPGAAAQTPAADTASTAGAVDLDQIQVLSGPGEPLLADIPITGADVATLKQVQAQLASPATFARIGLQRPTGIVSALQFAVARNRQGKPVVRVTSAVPVQTDFFTFLVQLQWPQGSMVREYSVALGAPLSMDATLPPPIQAPEQGPPNRIEAAPAPEAALDAQAPVAIPLAGQAEATAEAVAPEPVPVAPVPLVGDRRRAAPPPAPVAASPAPAPTRQQAPAERSAAPAPKPNAPAPLASKPTHASASKPVEATPGRTPSIASSLPKSPYKPPPAPGQGQYGPVRSGDTLSHIALRLRTADYNVDQTMLALQRTNPDAFPGGNINQLRRGAVLLAPSDTELARYDAAQASALVRVQEQQWRNGEVATVQPTAANNATVAAQPSTAATASSPASAPRLQILPATAAAVATAAAQSGGDAGGEGDRLTPASSAATVAQNEAMIARDLQIKDLQRRMAEMEIAQKQERLAAARDDTLAARQRSSVGWPWLLLAAALGFVLAWVLARRSRREPPPRADTAALPHRAADDLSSSMRSRKAGNDAGRPQGPRWSRDDSRDVPPAT